MQRLKVAPRPDWAARLRDVGISWAQGEYWQEGACYAFGPAEVGRIEQDAQTLVDLLLDTAGHVIEHGDLGALGIPAMLHAAVRESWGRRDPAVYMRLDLAYDGERLALLECNGQTPTSLIEASVAQWHWLEEQLHAGQLPPGTDQWNGVHEALLEQFGWLGTQTLHVAAADSAEDWATVTYLQDLAEQAGLSTTALDVCELGVTPGRRWLQDLAQQDIRRLLWLWPFEFAWEDAFAPELARTHTRFVEPLWKAVLSSKGLLAALHERHPACPLVLPASLRPGTLTGAVVHKPLYSREGQNVRILGPDADATRGGYGDLPVVEQQYLALPAYVAADSRPRYPVLGVWVAGQTVCGLGVREAAGRITDDRASFVPHVIWP